MNLRTIKAGFRSCGIYPFNPEAVNKSKIMPSDPIIPSTLTPSSSSTIQSPPSEPSIEPTTLLDTSTALSDTPAQPSPPVVTTNSTNDVSFTIDSSISTPTNPLVLTGLIPARLADVFITPSQQPVKKNSRVIIKERVLTSKEWRDKICQQKKEKNRSDPTKKGRARMEEKGER